MITKYVLNSKALLKDLTAYIPPTRIGRELGISEEEVNSWITGVFTPTLLLERQLVFYCLIERHLDVLINHRVTLPSYDIYTEFSFTDVPLGYEYQLEGNIILKNMPRLIAGKKVNYPLGVPASAITGTSKWIEFYSKRGFDILTYKTVRTREWPTHKYPNWGFVPSPEITNSKLGKKQIGSFFAWPRNPNSVTTANSFGIPSMAPGNWQDDIRVAKTLLSDGQMLIVSVTGTTPEGNETFEYLANDFAEAAHLASECGADVVELNLSCPNVGQHIEGKVYQSPEHSSKISRIVSDRLKDRKTPVFIKIGYLDKDLLTRVVEANSEYIQGIVAINTVSREVINEAREPLFDASRLNAGISGTAIKPYALEVSRNLVELREKKNYRFNILSVGGVITSDDAEDFLEIGADGVLSCTGAWMNPNLAIETRQFIGDTPLGNADYTTLRGKKPARGKVPNRMSKTPEHKPASGKEDQERVKTEEIAPGVKKLIFEQDDSMLKLMASLLKEEDGKLKLQSKPQKGMRVGPEMIGQKHN